MDEQELVYIQQLEQDNEQLKNQSGAMRAAVTNSSFFNKDDPNIISWQIDTNETLEKIEHFLRADVPMQDKKGNRYYVKQEQEDLILFNEYGITNLMRIFSNYIAKEHILSYYSDEQRINEMLADLGHAIRVFILCNYDKMGLNSAYKKSTYPLIVLSILHDVESTLRRALHAKQLEEINTGRIITQQQGMNPQQQPLLNKPKRWLNRFIP